ncbi:transposase [Vitiosangium sp. GDMCC 1.1324]|uniref:IS66 family transposase n=1 Tax=Vitiosangium sp. (strain GDMCC 1.1324) TaxID=2138576 RepID=UPI000D3861DC|nr:hypothetical protein DAT35_08900 [Vitiosangium sp. GDMCC 1.1324]
MAASWPTLRQASLGCCCISLSSPLSVPSGACGARLTAVVALRARTLWAFVHREQVEPTNNRAERALRPAVCMRKGSFGTHSPEGSRYIERMLTAVTTLKLQQCNVLDYLAAAHGQAVPCLLPAS